MSNGEYGYVYSSGSNVNNYLGGTWYTCGTPTISYYGSTVSADLWTESLLDKNTAQYIKNISETCTNAQSLISNNKEIYNNLSEDIRNNLENNLQRFNDLTDIIAEGNAALSALNTNLSKAYKNVCEAVYGQLGLSDLYKLYAQAEDLTSSLDNATPEYSPLLPT